MLVFGLRAALFSLPYLSCTVSAISPGGATSLPRVDVSETTFDVGYQLYWKPFSHSFSATNSGAAPLHLEVKSRSCGCVADIPSDLSVPPGATAEVQVGYEPTATKKRQGRNTFSIVLATNDPSHEEIALNVEATLVEPVHVANGPVEFVPQVVAALVTKRMKILCVQDLEMPRILSVEPSSPLIAVQLLDNREVQEGVRQSTYEVRVDLSQLPPDFSESIAIHTDSDRVPLVEVPVRAIKTAAVEVSPEHVLLGRIMVGEKKAKTVKLMWKDSADAPAKATSEDARVTATIIDTGIEHSCELDVEIYPSRQEGRVDFVKTTVQLFSTAGAVVGTVPVNAVLVKSE